MVTHNNAYYGEFSMSLKETLHTFSSKNVCYLYVSDFGIFLGFWLTFLSVIWLVFQLSQSSLSLGLMGFALNLPIFLILPFSGVLADRFNKQKILVWCSAGLLITPAILTWATWTGHASMTLLLIVAPIYGAVYAVMNPAVNAFIKEVVEQPEDVHRVTGLISSNTKVAQLLAAALNGVLHLFWSVTAAFMGAFLSHLLSLITFSRIQNRHPAPEIENTHPIRQLLEGVRYTFSFSPFWSVLMMAGAGSLIVLAWQWQLPVFVGDILGGSDKTLSLLFLCGGVGGILGGVYVSCRKHSAGLMRLATGALFVIAVGLMLFAFSTHRIWSYVLIFFIDGAWVVLLATTSATLQLLVDDNKRGRVMSFYSMAVFGCMPFINILLASLCTWLGLSWGVVIGGIFCFIMAGFYVVNISVYRDRLQSHYTKKSLSILERPI